MRKLTVGSLFSGIGGLERGLEMTGGFVTKWQVEIDKYARTVLARHWPKVHRCGDVRDFPDMDDYQCDVLVGGFPCQPVSCAGQRGGADDERWLWEDMRRVCEVVRPRWLVAENVRGLLSADGGRLFGGILRDLARLGFVVEWSLLSACSMGAAHSRERLFIVANSNGHRFQRGIGWAKESSNSDKILSQVRNTPTRARVNLPAPEFCRGADGISHRVQRTKCLGNAVVPQVAEWLGYRILEVEAWRNCN